MPEFLVIAILAIMFVFVLVGCIASVTAAIMMFRVTSFVWKINETLTSVGNSQEKLGEADIQVSGFMLKLADAISELRTSLKEAFAVQAESQEKVLESNVKISNQNSQTLMDVLVTLAQMMELILKGMGYMPQAPSESGLKDLGEQRDNYGAPRAPKNEDGLTFTKK